MRPLYLECVLSILNVFSKSAKEEEQAERKGAEGKGRGGEKEEEEEEEEERRRRMRRRRIDSFCSFNESPIPISRRQVS